ncbi:MAG: MarC family protein [Nitrosospira sp.]|nr:MarC family protein [Nitrosospira sp.]MDW7643158.1 MarC family protein [Nitrosomonadaceae bacterium]MDW7652824.1 MarC family protein [Nitrosomonadaceae bacterium]MDW7663958.1 MarC family protein [Nitrosomonadaceae bacterium]MDW7664702.1 MarC family protein [Nitrosomonadaceae bacterium]
MLSILALTIKKIITLLVLVGPISMIPIFLANTDGLDLRKKFQFARTIGISVTLVLLIATFLGMPILELLGISLGAMQIGGGIIVLLLAIAMVLGKESTFKGSPFIVEYEAKEISIVPLAVPLLAGPAAFSYVMGNGTWNSSADLIHIVLPTIAVGIACWFTFHMASQAEKKIQQSTLDVVQRIGGFILAAIAIEMIAIGLRGLFPILVTT